MKSAILAAILMLAAAPALAQQAPEKTYTLTVTAADLGVIANGLGELPAKTANPILGKLQAQINAQDAPAKPAEDKPKP